LRALRVPIAALIAFAVSAICLLPPGIHFVTGPIGPLIGGYVVGSRFRLNAGESAIVGLVMGVAIGAFLFVSFQKLDFMPNLAPRASIPLAIVGALYVGVLGTLGAGLGGRQGS
jgi:hypothetical protein